MGVRAVPTRKAFAMRRIRPKHARPRNPGRRLAYWTAMGTLFAIVGSSIGGWVGWILGQRIGFMTAYLTSIVGSAAGVYYGRRLYSDLLD